MNRLPVVCLAIAGWAVCTAAANAQPVITTVAGGGPNNVPALQASLAPEGLVVDSAGNMYVSVSFGNPRVFKIDAGGTLTVLAGVGSPYTGGDGGPATQAGLNYPTGLAFDAGRNWLYVAESLGHRIRKVDLATGLISTVAGTGAGGLAGDGGTATAALLNHPRQITLDPAGNLYIADLLNCRIRRVDVATGAIQTVAGTVCGFGGDGGPATAAAFQNPWGVAVDSSGNIYVSDTGNSRVRRISTGGIVTTYAGNGIYAWSGDGGLATAASLTGPRYLAFDSAGNLHVAEEGRVRKITASTGIITTVAGSIGGGAGQISFDLSGNLMMGAGNRVWRLVGGVASPVAGNGYVAYSGDGGPALDAAMGVVTAVLADASGNILVADATASRIRRVASNGIITTFANGFAAFCTDDMAGRPGEILVADHCGNRILRMDRSTGAVTTFAGTGTSGFSGDGGPATSAMLSSPTGVSVDGAGNVYIAEVGNRRIRRVDAVTGIITTVAGNGSSGSGGDGGAATNASLTWAEKVWSDPVGNLLIPDISAHRVRRVDAATGIITTAAGNGVAGSTGDGGPATSASLNAPFDVVQDALGNVYISESWGNRVRRVDAATGTISTVAGTGAAGFSGDGGGAASATLYSPLGLGFDAAGNLLIGDGQNRRVRRVTLVNTATGTNVAAQPLDPVTGTSPVSINFSNVTSGGTTTLSTSTTGAPPPSGFKTGNPPTYFDLQTTATFSGPVTVCVSYAGVSYTNEANLKLFHQEGNQWVDRTSSLDIVNKIICATVTSFSWFGVFESDAQKPVVSNVTVSPNPAVVGSVMTITATVSDASTGGSRITAAEYNVNGGAYVAMSAADGSFSSSTENVTATAPVGLTPAVLNVCVRGRDAASNWSDALCALAAVYDPSGGSVSGGGWIQSPLGAYAPNPSLTGKATFGFVSRYQKGATLPDGQTQFQFHGANLDFSSTSYQWLVVAGARAQFKGTGKINGAGNYGFLLTAIDGQVSGAGGLDRLRVKIWDAASGGIVYDNQPGMSDSGDDATEIGGGSIVIHQP